MIDARKIATDLIDGDLEAHNLPHLSYIDQIALISFLIGYILAAEWRDESWCNTSSGASVGNAGND